MIAANAPHSATPKNDPFPYVGEYGSRHAFPGTLNHKRLIFSPRPDYSQNEKDYQ